MKQNKELVWNVYVKNLNEHKIEVRNILKQNTRFAQDLYKLKKKYLTKNNFDFDTFIEEVRKDLQYYYWSRSEYEIILTSWTPNITSEEIDRLYKEKEEYKQKYGHEPYQLTPNLVISEKIDIYDQIMLNWEAFKLYLMINYKLIKKVEL